MLHFFGHVTTCILLPLKLMVMLKRTRYPQDAKHAGKASYYKSAVTRRFRFWPKMKSGETVGTDSLLDIATAHGAISSFSSHIG
ncbi:hypothetical protein M758_3G237600 [Ceratodon purpureus]|uniref:Uncharacterized protein n=1 Tax=Ceratodon purpureus TaxID=3225 RepID=A0A8T0IP98_CERPU|nr:hypothetical protein KC19_3G236000 [Ceratodon purpureus]KAG0624294.1 hypothetical protein M758_3G237600 [Ceratodon purpureus]